MSRLAKKPVKIPEGVTFKKEAGFLAVKGPKGELRVKINPPIDVEIKDGSVWLRREDSTARDANLGTAWSLVKNAIEGTTRGFSKFLEIEGIGYRVALEGKDLVLFLGYSQPVRLRIPDGVVLKIEKNVIETSGIDKELIGRFASKIKSLKKPEPYKGKGIRYRGEVIKRKIGKKAGATAGAA